MNRELKNAIEEGEKITVKGELFAATREGNTLMTLFLKREDNEIIGVLCEERYAQRILEENAVGEEVILFLENENQIILENVSEAFINDVPKRYESKSK